MSLYGYFDDLRRLGHLHCEHLTYLLFDCRPLHTPLTRNNVLYMRRTARLGMFFFCLGTNIAWRGCFGSDVHRWKSFQFDDHIGGFFYFLVLSYLAVVDFEKVHGKHVQCTKFSSRHKIPSCLSRSCLYPGGQSCLYCSAQNA